MKEGLEKFRYPKGEIQVGCGCLVPMFLIAGILTCIVSEAALVEGKRGGDINGLIVLIVSMLALGTIAAAM